MSYVFYKRIVFIVFALFVAACIFFIYIEWDKPAVLVVQPEVAAEQATVASDYSAELATVQAKSFYVYDVITGEPIFAKNEHQQLPLASITKLMSGLVSLDILPATTTVIIGKDDLAQDGDSGLFLYEKWNLKDLLDFTLISSSNDGIHAITSALDAYETTQNSTAIKIMNQEAHILGLSDTVFINTTGLDVDTTLSGAYSSTYDISKLLLYILQNKPQVISDTTVSSQKFESLSNLKHTAVNTDTLVNKVPSLLASKTGYTDLAGGNLIIAFDAGLAHPVIIAVMGSTEEGRFSDVATLVDVTLKKLSQ